MKQLFYRWSLVFTLASLLNLALVPLPVLAAEATQSGRPMICESPFILKDFSKLPSGVTALPSPEAVIKDGRLHTTGGQCELRLDNFGYLFQDKSATLVLRKLQLLDADSALTVASGMWNHNDESRVEMDIHISRERIDFIIGGQVMETRLWTDVWPADAPADVTLYYTPDFIYVLTNGEFQYGFPYHRFSKRATRDGGPYSFIHLRLSGVVSATEVKVDYSGQVLRDTRVKFRIGSDRRRYLYRYSDSLDFTPNFLVNQLEENPDPAHLYQFSYIAHVLNVGGSVFALASHFQSGDTWGDKTMHLFEMDKSTLHWTKLSDVYKTLREVDPDIGKFNLGGNLFKIDNETIGLALGYSTGDDEVFQVLRLLRYSLKTRQLSFLFTQDNHNCWTTMARKLHDAFPDVELKGLFLAPCFTCRQITADARGSRQIMLFYFWHGLGGEHECQTAGWIFDRGDFLNGRWGQRTRPYSPNPHEIRMGQAPNGDVWVSGRIQNYTSMLPIARSTDRGETWGEWHPTTMSSAGVSAYLEYIRKIGRFVLLTGGPGDQRCALRYTTSSDGVNWSPVATIMESRFVPNQGSGGYMAIFSNPTECMMENDDMLHFEEAYNYWAWTHGCREHMSYSVQTVFINPCRYLGLNPYNRLTDRPRSNSLIALRFDRQTGGFMGWKFLRQAGWR